MSLPPVEIPLGAMRFNSDSNKLEYWMGSAWMQIQTFSPNLNGGTRGVYAKGTQPGGDANLIQFITISTAGDAVDFGNLTDSRSAAGAIASNTRAMLLGGTSPGNVNTVDFVTISITSDAIDFGDLTGSYYLSLIHI